MYFKIETSKRGRKCSMCSEQIEASKHHFVYFDWDKTKMAYPVKDNICFGCADKITNKDFLDYIEQLARTLRMMRFKLKEQEEFETQEAPF